MKKKVDLGELALLVVSGVNVADVLNLIPLETIVGDIKIRRIFQAEGNKVLVQLRKTDDRKPEESMQLLAEKFHASNVQLVHSSIPGF